MDDLRPLLPEAVWSAPKPLTFDGSHGFLIQAVEKYRVYDGPFTGGGQGQSTARTGPPVDPGPFHMETSVQQIALFPVGDSVKSIPWPQEPNRWAILQSDLGVGRGFRWYGSGDMFFLSKVPKKLGLEGGESLAPLYIRGLRTEDEGSVTRNTAVGFLAQMKDEAVPFLHDEIMLNDKRTRWSCVYALSMMGTDLADEELAQLYVNPNPDLRKDVAHYVVWPPHHRKLKNIYADALAIPGKVSTVAQAARDFGWMDMLPAIEERFSEIGSPYDARLTYEAIAQMKSHDLDRYIDAAKAVRMNSEELTTLLACRDKTYVALVGLALLALPKVRPEDQSMGLKLLDSVPASVSKPLIERFRMADEIGRIRREPRLPQGGYRKASRT